MFNRLLLSSLMAFSTFALVDQQSAVGGMVAVGGATFTSGVNPAVRYKGFSNTSGVNTGTTGSKRFRCWCKSG